MSDSRKSLLVVEKLNASREASQSAPLTSAPDRSAMALEARSVVDAKSGRILKQPSNGASSTSCQAELEVSPTKQTCAHVSCCLTRHFVVHSSDSHRHVN